VGDPIANVCSTYVLIATDLFFTDSLWRAHSSISMQRSLSNPLRIATHCEFDGSDPSDGRGRLRYTRQSKVTRQRKLDGAGKAKVPCQRMLGGDPPREWSAEHRSGRL